MLAFHTRALFVDKAQPLTISLELTGPFSLQVTRVLDLLIMGPMIIIYM